jgi:predicted AAA+ superfamily ATPase
MHGIKRSCFASIHYLLNHFPCVAVIGARQVGKTTLLKQILPDAQFFDLEKRADYERISYDPDFFLSQTDPPVVIDEAQQLPELFPALRVAIDRHRNSKGRFLISGSSSPQLLSQISESLAGRIAIFELSGFSLEEIWQLPANPLYDYLNQKNSTAILDLPSRLNSHQMMISCLHGSYPEPVLYYRSDAKAFQLWMENYFQTYINRDIRTLFPSLNFNAYQRFIAMLAAASGTIINTSEFARSLDVSQPTAKNYFQIADGTFIWRTLLSFQKNLNKRMIKMPKGYLRDSGLLNFILKTTSLEALYNQPNFGAIWEGFVMEEIIKGFKNRLIPIQTSHYRTGNQAEIDLILEGEFGILPIEIKSGTFTPAKKLLAITEFVKTQKLPYGLLINNSDAPAWVSPHILQIPAGLL